MIAEARPRCPVCRTVCRHWLARGDRDYAKCPRCQTAHMTNPPRSAELKDLYSNTVFTLPGNDQYYEDDPTNLAAARARRRWVERSVSSGRLLDIGCGCGHFLAVLNSRRWSAQGIDISPLAVRRARQRFNVRCEARPFAELPDSWRGCFDAVTMWDVIEHVPDPFAALSCAASMLRPGGSLFLSTPDISAIAARMLGKRWHYIDPMQHLCLFSRDSLIQLCARTGLQAARSRPFGRSYTLGYLLYRVGYCFPIPGLRAAASASARVLRSMRDLSVPIMLGDIVGLEAVKPAREVT